MILTLSGGAALDLDGGSANVKTVDVSANMIICPFGIRANMNDARDFPYRLLAGL